MDKIILEHKVVFCPCAVFLGFVLTVSWQPCPEKGARFQCEGWKALPDFLKHCRSFCLQKLAGVALLSESWANKPHLSPLSLGFWTVGSNHTYHCEERICWAEFINYGPNICAPILNLPILRQCKNRVKTFVILVLLYWQCARTTTTRKEYFAYNNLGIFICFFKRNPRHLKKPLCHWELSISL